MGSKVDDVNNSNMLTQTTAQYLIGSKGQIYEAGVETWKKDWSYREYNSAIPGYEYVTASSTADEFWRKHQTYIWNGQTNGDGSLKNYSEFDWVNSPNLSWQIANEITGYNHYSQAIESKDINGKYNAVKYGNQQQYPLVAWTNAKQTEVYYSGAEDGVDNIPFFGGEVKGKGNQYLSSIRAHTGSACVLLTQGERAFKIDLGVGAGTNDQLSSKTYRASVWLRRLNKANGRLIYKIKDNNTVLEQKTAVWNSSNTVKAGNWYLLNIDIPIDQFPSANNISVWVENNGSGDVYFDDFRFFPIGAQVKSFVYDSETGRLLAVLDSDNFGTKYYYDHTGRVIKTEVEFADTDDLAGGFKTIKENIYHHGR